MMKRGNQVYSYLRFWSERWQRWASSDMRVREHR